MKWNWRGKSYRAAFMDCRARIVIVRAERGRAEVWKVIRTRWLSDIIWAFKRLIRAA